MTVEKDFESSVMSMIDILERTFDISFYDYQKAIITECIVNEKKILDIEGEFMPHVDS